MILCVCFNVSDRVVRQRASEGASLGEVLEETGAGSACGCCRLAIARAHAGERAPAPPCQARRASEAADVAA
jgi:bacterioferritin-associated ferredoxin